MNGHIAHFRRFNRFYTNTLGLLSRRLLDSPLGLAEARVLYELRETPGIFAVTLSASLGMDRGQLSRIISRLHRAGYIERDSSPSGRKGVPLNPAPAGLNLLDELDQAANEHAASLLGHLDGPASDNLTSALNTVERLLAPRCPQADLIIRPARSGDMAWIIDRHVALYEREYGFDMDFEGYVLLGLAAYLELPDKSRSRIFIAEQCGNRLGSVAIVENENNQAQLRWLLVSPKARGKGVGRKLIREAIGFATTKRYASIFLWTLSFLTPARKLYESFNFDLIEAKKSNMGGKQLTEERWNVSLI